MMYEEDEYWHKRREAKKREPESQGKEHRDYTKNLLWSQRLIDNCKGKLPTHMFLDICDSHGLKQVNLLINYKPPKHWPIGNYSTPICFHQDHPIFKVEVNKLFNQYYGLSKRWNAKNLDG